MSLVSAKADTQPQATIARNSFHRQYSDAIISDCSQETMPNQNTLLASFTLSGVGIHTGTMGRIVVQPAEENTGRVFQVEGVRIPARAENVVDTRRCTTLGKDGATVSTVEHLLSALAGFEIDNAVIEVEGPEIPILDGSALPFAEAVQSVGIQQQSAPAAMLRLPEDVALVVGESECSAESESDTFGYETTVDFDEWKEGRAVNGGRMGEIFGGVSESGTTITAFLEIGAYYTKYIAPARTFAFRHEVDALIAAGLAKGGSLDNALVITPPDEFSSPLRLSHEWAVHKTLDLIGDLALTDCRLPIYVAAYKPGHRINTQFAKLLLDVGRIERKG